MGCFIMAIGLIGGAIAANRKQMSLAFFIFGLGILLGLVAFSLK